MGMVCIAYTRNNVHSQVHSDPVFGFFVYRHINLRGLFNAKDTIVEER